MTLRHHYQPIRRAMWSDATDPHFHGPIVVELSPDGIRWWWEGQEHGDPQGVISASDLVQTSFVHDVEEIADNVAITRKRLDHIRGLVEQVDRMTAWKLLR